MKQGLAAVYLANIDGYRAHRLPSVHLLDTLSSDPLRPIWRTVVVSNPMKPSRSVHMVDTKNISFEGEVLLPKAHQILRIMTATRSAERAARTWCLERTQGM